MSKVIQDKKEVWQDEARPLIEKLFDLAKQHDIPFLCAASITAEDDGHTLCTSYYNSDNQDIFNQDLNVCSNILTQQAHAVNIGKLLATSGQGDLLAKLKSAVGKALEEHGVAAAPEDKPQTLH